MRSLARLGCCTSGSESLMVTQILLKVLSCAGSNADLNDYVPHPPPPTPSYQSDGKTYCFWDGSQWRRRQRRRRRKTSCQLYNFNTLWNIFMILGRNIEQDHTTCRVQERQLCLSYLWRYHPLLYLTEISH